MAFAKGGFQLAFRGFHLVRRQLRERLLENALPVCIGQHTLRPGQARLQAQGAKVTGSVSRNTDFVVVGRDPGSKAARAEQLGVALLDEQALLELLAQ